MNILRKLLKKDPRTLVIADDGNGVWGIVTENDGICTDYHFPAGTDLKKILDFGKEQKALKVLYLQTADVRELEVKLGADLSEDERRSAIEYAAAGSVNDRSGSQRISYLDGMFHDFRSGILASYFDTGEIISTAGLVKSARMKFAGVTNFKQLLLAQHFSRTDHHGDAFLFMLGTHGIAAVPERNRLLIRNLPFGLPEQENEAEWLERIQRRLNTVFKNKRVCFYTPQSDEKTVLLLKEAAGAEMIEVMNWEEAIINGALYFLNGGSQLIHPALPPPREKDPKASGTYIGLLFLAVTLLSLGFLAGRNLLTGYLLSSEIAAAQAKIDTVQKEKDALKELEKKLSAQQEILKVMKLQQRVSANCMLVINLLGRYPLQYSRITAIEEKATGIFIEGESIWQPDLSRFFTHFEGELSKYDLTLFSDGLSKDKEGKIIFRSHVGAGGGVR